MANLKFTSSGSTTIQLVAVGTPFLTYFFVRKNGSDIIQSYTMGSGITLSDGEQISFSNPIGNLSKDGSNYYQFVITGDGTVEVEGDLVSLIWKKAVKQYQFINLFRNCTKITSISGLNFPASIADFCYSNMFAGCTGLVNAGTTLPATTVSRWCYNGMFVDCSSMTTPPTILAENVAPFSYYQMFAGCSSLTDGPQLRNKTVAGKMNSNCMFKGCSNLSSIQVSFTSWPAEADQNESRNWLSGVYPTGLFVYPTTLTIPTGVVPAGWTLSSTYPATIVVSDMTIDFDAMLDQVQLSSLAYGYVGGTETVNIAIDDTNKPAWLTYTADSDSIDFSANGYSINTNASFILPITFSAADAATKNVNVTFNVLNYPTATITVSTIPTFSFDAESQTDIVSSLMTYATGSNSISCQIEGELPAGLSCVDGIITGVPADFTANYSGSFDIIYSASDARNVSSSFDLEIINPVYSTMPLTFKSIGNTTVKLAASGSINQLISASTDGGTTWTSYRPGLLISLSDGQTVAFSGTNNFSPGYYLYRYFQTGGTGKLQVMGNLFSLNNFDTTQVRQHEFMFMFSGCANIVDASNLKMPATTLNDQCYYYMFQNCTSLTAAPQLPATNLSTACYYGMFASCSSLLTIPTLPATEPADFCYYGMFASCSGITSAEINLTSLSAYSLYLMFNRCANLSNITVHFTDWRADLNATNYWLYNVAPTGTFNKPAALPTIYGTSNIPSGWTVVNK